MSSAFDLLIAEGRVNSARFWHRIAVEAITRPQDEEGRTRGEIEAAKRGLAEAQLRALGPAVARAYLVGLARGRRLAGSAGTSPARGPGAGAGTMAGTKEAK